MISPRLNKMLATAGMVSWFVVFGIATTYTPVDPPEVHPQEFERMPCHQIETADDVIVHNTNLLIPYAGTFVWDNDTQVQSLYLQATNERKIMTTFGVVSVFSGHGTYRVGDVETKIEFDMTFMGDGSFTMVEKNPSRDGFVTDGQHSGNIMPNGTIQARWEDYQNPERSGTLRLAPM